MRLLLLLSAFMTALTGAMVGSAALAQRVETSVSTTHAKAGTSVKVTAPLPEEVQGAYAAPGTWHARLVQPVRVQRKTYGERRRE